MAYVKSPTYDHDITDEWGSCPDDHIDGCPGKAGGDHEFRLSMMRCSECGDLLRMDGSCATHGLLDPEQMVFDEEQTDG